jgi:hypothetical protein
MSILQDLFFDIVRQGLPTIGAISGLTWATADGQARDRKGMLVRGLLGATIGWGIGYVARIGILKAIDAIPGAALPGDVASLGPSTGQMAGVEAGTMPNPTYHPKPFAQEANMPEPVILDGEGSQVINITEQQQVRSAKAKKPLSQDNVEVKGTLASDAFGKL